jgi:hypothetical protein
MALELFIEVMPDLILHTRPKRKRMRCMTGIALDEQRKQHGQGRIT